MGFFRKRRTAVGVFAAAVVVFSLLGGHRSLSKACRAVEATFFVSENNAADSYYTCPGEQLGYCVKYANRLLSVLGGGDAFSDVYAAVSEARLSLDDALEAGDISAAYTANEALKTAVSDAETLVSSGAQLPASNDDYKAIVSDFASAEALVDRSGYNAGVDAFLEKTIQVFPADVLRALTGVKTPEKFA